MNLSEAKEWLRVDNDDNDILIASLLDATTEYIKQATGVEDDGRPLVKTIKKFLLSLWYDPTQSDPNKLQRTIDSLLKLL